VGKNAGALILLGGQLNFLLNKRKETNIQISIFFIYEDNILCNKCAAGVAKSIFFLFKSNIVYLENT